MKISAFALGTIGAALSTSAYADIATCRAIANNAKRLACYDRLDATTETATNLDSVESARTSQAKDLSGFYVAGSISAGTSTSISQFELPSFGINKTFDDLRHSSPSAGLIVGYNAFSGPMLFGAELEIRSDLRSDERHKQEPIYSQGYPRLAGWGWSSVSQPAGTIQPYSYPGGTQQNDTRRAYSYREMISPTLSTRIGYQFDDWLIYSRVGAGVVRMKETLTTDDSRSIYCTTTEGYIAYEAGGNFKDYASGCSGAYGGKIVSSSQTITRPSATLALGAEYHFDRYFTRVEGEVRHLFLDDKLSFAPSSGMTQYRINTALGIRF